MNYLELIENRNSIRDFHKKKVEQSKIDELISFFNSSPKLIDVDVQILVSADDDTASRLSGVAGYRGNTFNAPAYITILSDEKDNYLINAGFMAENLVLKLEEMGLSSCFLTSDDSEMIKKVLLINSDLSTVYFSISLSVSILF